MVYVHFRLSVARGMRYALMVLLGVIISLVWMFVSGMTILFTV